MKPQIAEPVAQTEPVRQSDALFLARLEAEAQQRFARRLLAGLMAFLLLWLAGLWYFWRPAWRPWQPRTEAARAQAKVAAARADLERELVRLQDQLSRAVAETVSLKLEALEARIRAGQAGPRDLELIQSIKQDVGLLATKSSQATLPAGAQPQATLGSEAVGRLGQLETLVYLSLGVICVVLIAAGGCFLRCGIQLKRLEREMTKLSSQLPLPRH